MDLTGISPLLGPITVRESPLQQSQGQVKQQNPGVDFPAASFFDVFFEIETPLGTLHNKEPIRMQAYDGIDAIPPILRPYIASTPACVTLYNSLNIAVGCIQHAMHIPVPPYEKIVIFTSRPIPPPTPTPTPAPAKTTPTLSAAQEIRCGEVWSYYGSGFTPNGRVFKSFFLPGGVTVTAEWQADGDGKFSGTFNTDCAYQGVMTLSAVDQATGQEARISVNVVP